MTVSIQQITAAAVAGLTLAAGVAFAQTTPGTGETGNSSTTQQPMTQQGNLPGNTGTTGTNSTTGNTGSVGNSTPGTSSTQGNMGSAGNTGLGNDRTNTSRTDMAYTDRAARADRN